MKLYGESCVVSRAWHSQDMVFVWNKMIKSRSKEEKQRNKLINANKIDQSSSLTETAALLMLLVASLTWDVAVSTASKITLLAGRLAARSAS